MAKRAESAAARLLASHAITGLPVDAEAIARAEAWLVVPAGSEGFAVGTPVDADMLRE